MTPIQGFPLRTVYNITNITQSKPGTVTLESVDDLNTYPVALGQTITITNTSGMRQLNDKRFIIGNFDADSMTFDLYDLSFKPVDTTYFQNYISSGQIDIVSFPATATEPAGLMNLM